jgi:hypothetical protein
MDLKVSAEMAADAQLHLPVCLGSIKAKGVFPHLMGSMRSKQWMKV